MVSQQVLWFDVRRDSSDDVLSGVVGRYWQVTSWREADCIAGVTRLSPGCVVVVEMAYPPHHCGI